MRHGLQAPCYGSIMKKTIFITRDLTLDSDFLRLLSEVGWEVEGFALLEFSRVPFVLPPAVEWIFFYSKNGIKFFFEHLKFDKERWQTFLKRQASGSTKLAVMGSASAAYLLEYKLKADFVGTGNPAITAPAFLRMAKGQRVLFAHAKNSRHSIRKLIENQVDAIDLLVYKNTKKTNFHESEAEVLVFTSPMNVAVYFEKYNLKKHQKLVAIGHTTATKLTEMGYDKFKIAAQATEAALAEAVVSITE